MNDMTALVIIVALLVIGAVAWMYLRERRTTALRSRFGPEYDRQVREIGDRRRAEAELDHRARRVERLSIRPLPPTDRQRYIDRWSAEQAHFVDDPGAAVGEADHLVQEVMSKRGYPVSEFDQQAADLSVDHPHVIENYRAAHDIAVRQSRGQAATEELRRAMLYYRSLFEDLLQDRPREEPAR